MSRSEYAPLLERALRRIRAAKAELAESRRPASSRCPTAVLGMACRLPGADDPDALWRMLSAGTDAVGPLPPDRWTPAEWAALPGSIALPTDRCGTLRDVAGFDPRFFGIAPREAQTLDPLQRILLETAWHALEDAGLPGGRLRGRRVGVFVGIGPSEYIGVCTRRGVPAAAFSATSNALSVIAGRVAYAFGLQGPALVVDTACSSSLVALQLAVRALQAGDCEVALAGGINLLIDPVTTLGMARLKMLSPVGECRSFDADGAGFVRGEGCGVVVLRRLADAERDGQRCRAVIRGVAVNQDGRSAGITAPNKHAQVAVIRAALADGALDPHAVTYVESHGTGTALGDPIEMGAIEEALCTDRPADAPIVIGALKSNIGHLEAASGIAGLIKATLAIEHRRIPPNLHFDTPNPHIPWERLPVHMPRDVTPWQPGLVGVSSFGFSGTNAHVILGPPPPRPAPAATAPARGVEVLPLSARSERALATLAARYADRLAGSDGAWPAVAASAAAHREPMAHRATVLATSAEQAVERLRALADEREAAGVDRALLPAGRAPRIGFLFTGQGAQYAGMGRRLYAEEPVFARAIDRCAAHLDGRLPRPLTGLLFDDDSPIDHTAFTQPTIFALQVALAALWRSLGVIPHAVLGHSVGAYAAAVVAGALEFEDGLDLIAERGRQMGALPGGGAMAAVEADERRVLAAARGAEWSVAAINSPRETVISGSAEAIDRAVADFAADGVRARRLTVSHAFHSAQMQPAVAPLRALAARMPSRAPQLHFVDDRTGALHRAAPTPDHWSRHVREPVRFRDALRTLDGLGCDLLIELGPRPVLLGMARRTLGEACPTAVPSLRPGRPPLVEALATAWRMGAPVDWSARWAGRGLPRVDLPRYPFDHSRCWLTADGPRPAPDDGSPALYDLRWRALPPAASAPPTGRWLIACDAGGVGRALIDALRAVGADAEAAPAGAAALAGAAVQGPGWRGVVDLTALDAPSLARGDGDGSIADRLDRARSLTVDGPLATLGALVQHKRTGTRLYLVTRGAASVAGLAEPAQALRAGLGRVMAAERAAWFGGLFDLEPGEPAAAAAGALMGVLGAPIGERGPLEIALRGGGRRVPRYAPHRADPRADAREVGDGTILITGGTGALGMHVAGRLVDRGARHLVLLSRRGPGPDAAARIECWRVAGIDVRPATVDVARADELRALVEAIDARGPPLTGVVHAAGVLDDGLLHDMTPARVDRVVWPKLGGALALDAALGDRPLSFCVFFSSIVAQLGNAGQANYAAANAALDALAARRCARGCPTLAIQWGPWQGAGMAVDLPRQGRRGDAIRPLAPDLGLALFDRLLIERGPLVAAVTLGAASAGPLFAEARPDADGAPPPRQPRGYLAAALSDLEPDARAPRVGEALTSYVARALGLEPDEIDDGRSVVDLGMDSLLVQDVLKRLEHALDLSLYPREFYAQPSMRAMAAYLVAELDRADAAGGVQIISGGEHAFAPLDRALDPDLAPPAPLDGFGFVLSAPRSGSTLLRVMLGGHPDLFAPPELWLLLADDMAQRARVLGPTSMEQGLVIAARSALGCTTEEAEAQVAALVQAATPTWQVYATLGRWSGRTVIDKTPGYAWRPATLDRIPRWFAPGPLIHLVRHPLAAMQSMVRLRLDRLVSASANDPWTAAEAIWQSSARSLLDFDARLVDRAMHRVRFEALVRAPRATMQALTDALGLPFAPAMLDPYSGDRMTGGLRATSAPVGDARFASRDAIDPALADAWRDVRPPHPLQPETRALADALGYELPARGDVVAVGAAPARAASDASARSTNVPSESSGMPSESFGMPSESFGMLSESSGVPSESSGVPSGPITQAGAEGARPLRFTVGRLRLAGLQWGPEAGPAIVAVHGLLDHAGIWAPAAERWAARGLRVIAPDLRGHGASDHLSAESGYAAIDYVQDLAAALDREGCAPRALVGHSLGALVVALHAAMGAGDRPLVLVEPPLPTAGEPTADELARWLEARRSPPSHPLLADLDAAVARLTAAMPQVPADALRRFAARAVRHRSGGVAWRCDPRLRLRTELTGLSTERWLALLGSLNPAPTLLFAGDSLRVRSADRARQVAAVPDGETRTVDGGHHLPLSAPDVVADAVLDALAAHGRGEC